MTEFAFLDMPIEVAAESPRREMIMSRLRQEGFRPYAAPARIDFSASDALMLDMESVTRETLQRLARAEMGGHDRMIVVLDPAETNLELSKALTLRRDKDISLLRDKLVALKRRTARLKEAKIRLQTAKQFGANLKSVDPDTAPNVLYLGSGGPNFLSLQHALAARDVEIAAALTVRSAKTYLCEKRFSAILVDVTSNSEDIRQILDWNFPEGSLSGLPIIALTDDTLNISETAQEALPLTSELVDIKTDTKAAAEKIERLGRKYLATTPLTPEITLCTKISDLTTGLFNGKFLEAHTAKQIELCSDISEPLCMMTIKLSGPSAGNRDTLKTAAGLVAKMLRETDCPATTAIGVFTISLPFTPYRGAVRLAERIEEYFKQNSQLTDVEMNWRVVERRAYHTPKTLINAGSKGPFVRTSAA